ncbi:glycosyltransferase family protein [Phenylobacterium sp. LH3H17]|uniref:cytidylyltransferase domain-containing protein n=1 Tax=Phenylobacterium sp. LH3H17 TaxID=2903901 RepID=UPI0020C981BF|nr:glycosyltransferase family protein [Phenylobacterium sp. LH3H17]UTP38611.1 glycosyltransferase family protein [Phenylobacterium sp. LH3H17]
MIAAILQARMSSTRLPGKVLADLAGAPMIARQIERLSRARAIDRLIVATSDDRSDDVLADHLTKAGVEVFRGSMQDVLARYAGAAAALDEADLVVRLTADCPLTDPGLIDTMIGRQLASQAHYTATTLPTRTYPKGLDAEVMSVGTLRLAAAEAVDPYEREHVTPFIYRRPERFTLGGVSQDRDEGEVRWTVDRPDDLDFVRAVYEALYREGEHFTSDDIRRLVRGRPDLARLGGDPRV